MSRLILIRHGETLWNREFRLQGSSDVPLSDLGERQSRFLVSAFTETPTAIYVSPLIRAKSYAAPLAARFGMRPQIVENLREISFGRFEGLRYEDMDDSLRQAFISWIENPVVNTAPEGERFISLAARAREAVEEIIGKVKKDEFAVVVTHGGVIRALVASLMDMPLETAARIEAYPGSLTTLEKAANGWKLVKLNDTGYLDNNL